MLEPISNCSLCPRLVAYREENRMLHPGWHNSPVKSFGNLEAELLVLGLAPGVKGANRTGRPFTGDHAGRLLYSTLLKFGFAIGKFGASSDDGLKLVNCRITNAVRCVPPLNKPTRSEIMACEQFLVKEIDAMPNLKVVLALGTIAHNAVLHAFKLKINAWKFAHNVCHELGVGPVLFDSYHCSRYNTNTGRLTEIMFHDVFQSIRKYISIKPKSDECSNAFHR